MQGNHVHVKIRIDRPGVRTCFVERDQLGTYVDVEGWRYRHPALETLESKALQIIASPNGKVVIRDLVSQICVIEPTNPPLFAKLMHGTIERKPKARRGGLLGRSVEIVARALRTGGRS